MPTPDIADLTYPQLHDLRVHITERMKEMRESGTEQLRLTFIDAAAALGLAPEDIFGVQKKQRSKRRKHKEEDGNDPTAT